MKASSLVKKDTDLKEIYSDIENANNNGHFKIPIPHNRVFSDSAKMELIENGFKVYKGSWDGVLIDCYIIEW